MPPTMSFACPHFDPDHDACRLLKQDCVPGRRGCVLAGSTFAVPVAERLAERERLNRERAWRERLGGAEPAPDR